MILLALAVPASAQVASGTASALDGDSLVIGTKEVRLVGIDAPEFEQTCQKGGTAWACGHIAKDRLAALIAGRRVDCRGQGVDIYRRILAVCTTNGIELNAAQVEQGWAIAFREYSDAYVPAEERAKGARRGIWSTEFVAPQQYRLGKLPPAERPPRSSRNGNVSSRAPAQPAIRRGACVIKGNRNQRGQWIYHVPGMPYYNQTRAEEIFCTEAEAQAAGYRRALMK